LIFSSIRSITRWRNREIFELEFSNFVGLAARPIGNFDPPSGLAGYSRVRA
jgi:hypothetical protein